MHLLIVVYPNSFIPWNVVPQERPLERFSILIPACQLRDEVFQHRMLAEILVIPILIVRFERSIYKQCSMFPRVAVVSYCACTYARELVTVLCVVKYPFNWPTRYLI